MSTLAMYLLGGPGSGKSTLAAAVMAALGGRDPVQVERPVPHLDHGNGWLELGRRRPSFSGTDALSYSVGPAAVAWVTGADRPGRLLAEGDRLATGTFLTALSGSYDGLVVVHLTAPAGVLWDRMVARAEALGVAPQSTGWWKGRITKAARAAEAFGAVPVDARLPTAVQVGEVLAEISRKVGEPRCEPDHGRLT